MITTNRVAVIRWMMMMSSSQLSICMILKTIIVLTIGSIMIPSLLVDNNNNHNSFFVVNGTPLVFPPSGLSFLNVPKQLSSSSSMLEVFLLRGGDSSSNEIHVKDDSDNDDDDDEEEEGDENTITVPSGTSINDGDDDEEEDDEEEEEEDHVVVASQKKTKVDRTTKLATATLKSVTKTKDQVVQQQTAIVKDVVQKQLLKTATTAKKIKTTTKQLSVSSLYQRMVPYIIRATINPLTFIAMTKSYWLSLFNLNYLQQHIQEQNGGSNVLLRTAYEEQEKRKLSLPSSSKRNKKSMKRGQAKTLNDLPKLSS